MELDNIKIENIIREELYKLITEEKSVSNEVLKLKDSILSNFMNGRFNFKTELYDLGTYDVIGTSKEVPSPLIKMNAALDVANHVLSITIPIYNGKIVYETLSEEISHELEHAFQVSKLNNTDNGTKKSYNALYDIAIKNGNSKEANYYQRELARLVYCSSTLEQDAFVNGLYSDLMSYKITNNRDEIDVFKNSQAYKALNTIRDVRNEIMEGDGSFGYAEAAKDYDKKLRWFIYLADNAESRLKSKIKNVILKAREDRLKNVPFHNINLDGVGR